MKHLWAWAPATILLLFIATRLLMLSAMQDVSVDRTVADPYVASMHFGANQAARHAFHQAGLSLEVRDGALQLVGPASAVQAVQVNVRHPARADFDRDFSWEVPTKPLVLENVRAGLWQVTFTGALSDGTPIRHEMPIRR